MSYVVLARKWRPMSFEDLVGQEHVARTLSNAIDTGRVAHAFLFTGVRGVGKTTSARILAKALNCMRAPGSREPGSADPGPTPTPCLECPACREITLGNDMDVREIDGASYNGVDEVRKLQDSIPFRPSRDRFKIYIVDEVHMLSAAAWNAFLKTLEEPPPHVKFIFATTEVHKVPITILSRVQRFDFKMIPARLIISRLRHVLGQEGISTDEAALSILAREAAGSMRDAMSLLDQVIAWGGNDLKGEDVARVLGVASHRVLHDIAGALVVGDGPRCLDVVQELASQGYDIAHVAKDLLQLLRDLVVAKVSKNPDSLLDLPDEERGDVVKLASQAQVDDLVRLHQGFSQGFDDVLRSGQPRGALEMLLVRLSRRPPLLPIDELLVRLGNLERRLTAGARPNGDGGRGGPPSSPQGGGRGMGPGPGSNPAGHGPPSGRASSASSAEDRLDGLDLMIDNEAPPPSGPAAISQSLDARGTGIRNGGSPYSSPTSSAAPPSRPPRSRNSAELGTAEALLEEFPYPVREVVQHRPARALPQPPPLPRPDESPVEFQKLETWRRLIDEIGETRPQMAAFLQHAAALRLDGDRLVLALEPQTVFSDQVGTKECEEELRRVALAHFGRAPQIVLELDRSRLDSSPTIAQADAEVRDRKKREAYERAQQHPLIREAMEILGARLRSIKLPD